MKALQLAKATAKDRAAACEIAIALAEAERVVASQKRRGAAAVARAAQAALKKVGKGKGVSIATLQRKYEKWRQGGLPALLPSYGAAASKLPAEFVAELRRRATLPGAAEFSRAIDSIVTDWRAGHEIPGLGTWQDWYFARWPDAVVPPGVVPDFFTVVASRATLYRHQPSAPVKRRGASGASSAKELQPYVQRDYTHLRRCEGYTLDDVKLDLMVIDEATDKVTTVVCYVMMEMASRYIVGHVLKPAKAIGAEDVDELVKEALQSPTLGVGDGYTTHIYFERGSVACSELMQLVLESDPECSIKVHRTGMVGAAPWIGGPNERGKGNSSGKGMIEAFNRQLHLLLRNLPGQTGSTYEAQPATLGWTGQTNKDGTQKTHKGSLISEAEMLAGLRDAQGKRLKLDLGMLTLRELMPIVAKAIRRHNEEPGHRYSGHGTHWLQETAPGVWQPVKDDTLSQTPSQPPLHPAPATQCDETELSTPLYKNSTPDLDPPNRFRTS